MDSKKLVILDTDPGLDDAIALFFMMGRRDILEPLAVTTVFGNVPIEKNYCKCCKIIKFFRYRPYPCLSRGWQSLGSGQSIRRNDPWRIGLR